MRLEKQSRGGTMNGAKLLSFFERVAGRREDYWICRGHTISVCTCISAPLDKVSNNGKGTEMARRAEKEAERLLRDAGISVKSSGSMLRGHSKKVIAMGIADAEWSPEAEKALAEHGLVRVKEEASCH